MNRDRRRCWALYGALAITLLLALLGGNSVSWADTCAGCGIYTLGSEGFPMETWWHAAPYYGDTQGDYYVEPACEPPSFSQYWVVCQYQRTQLQLVANDGDTCGNDACRDGGPHWDDILEEYVGGTAFTVDWEIPSGVTLLGQEQPPDWYHCMYLDFVSSRNLAFDTLGVFMISWDVTDPHVVEQTAETDHRDLSVVVLPTTYDPLSSAEEESGDPDDPTSPFDDCAGFPAVSLRHKQVYVVPCPLGPGYDGTNAGSDGRKFQLLELLDCDLHVRFYDGSGKPRTGQLTEEALEGLVSSGWHLASAKTEAFPYNRTPFPDSVWGYNPPLGAGPCDCEAQMPLFGCTEGGKPVLAVDLGDGYTAVLYVRANSTLYIIVTGPDGTRWHFDLFWAVVEGEEKLVVRPCWVEGGMEEAVRRSFVRDACAKVLEATDEKGTWYYSYDDSNYCRMITTITAPDGTYTVLTYCAPEEDGAGKIKSIKVYDSEADFVAELDPISTTQYSYDQDDQLVYVTRGNRRVHYSYDTDSIVVSEQSASGYEVFRTVSFVYDESSPKTTVTRTGDANQPSQTTVYNFAGTASARGKITSIEDPYYNPSNPNNHKVTLSWKPNTNYLSSVTYEGYTTSAELNAGGAPTSVQVAVGTNPPLIKEFCSYYGQSVWPKTYIDSLGNCVHFVRNTDTLKNADAVQVGKATWDTDHWDEPEWGQINDPYIAIKPIRNYEYYSDRPDITDTATFDDDEHTYGTNPTWTAAHLNDKMVGVTEDDEENLLGREDVGNWDYSSTYGSDYTYANVSMWTWTTAKTVSGVDLYLDPSVETTYGLNPPSALKVLAKDGSGNYTVEVYDTATDEGWSWRDESWGGRDVKALHIKCDVTTTGLLVVYGRSSGICHLGEVVVRGEAPTSPEGRDGQLKKIIVPEAVAEGSADLETEFGYKQGVDTIRDFPTWINYKDATGAERTTTVSLTESPGSANNRTYTVSNENDPNDPNDDYQVKLQYDALKRTKKVFSGNDIYLEKEYECCTLKWVKDAEENKVHFDYDNDNRPIKVWTDIQSTSDTLGQNEDPLLTYAYNRLGNVKEVETYSDLNAPRLSEYTYDKLDVPQTMDYPSDLIGQEGFGYNDSWRTCWSKDGNGKYTWYTFNEIGEIEGVYYGETAAPTARPTGTADVTLNYAPADGPGFTYGHLVTSIVDGVGTHHFYYDNLDRLAGYTPAGHDPEDYLIRYKYNNLGEKTYIGIGAPASTDYVNCELDDVTYEVTYTYYGNGQLHEVKSGAVTIADYDECDPIGNLKKVTYGNGTTTELSYGNGPTYWLESIIHKASGGSTLASFSYGTRDGEGNPATITDPVGEWSFAFDANNRLTAATPPNPVPDQPAGGSYVFDWVGNRTSPPADPNFMTYNAVDQLTSWPGMYDYTYYSDGSLHEVKKYGTATVVASYVYGNDGQLSTATHGSVTDTMTWDALGNRVSFQIGSQNPYTFVYDVTAGVPAVLEEVTPSGTFHYYRTPDGALIARHDSSNGWRYYHFDELGSTRMLTDGSGNVTDKYSYDAWGSLIWHERLTGTIDQPYQYVGALGYYTHYQDPDFKLLQLGFRFYDTETGRFSQQDPIGDGLNWYEYCGGSPLTGVDPWGLMAWYDKLIQGAADFSAGMGDTISFGLTNKIRRGMGTDQYVNYGSGAHVAGRVGGYAWHAAAAATGVNAGIHAAKGYLAARAATTVAGASTGAYYVYQLIKDGRVVYVGRTMDVLRRVGEHVRNKGDVDWEIVREGLTYAQARGLEQLMIMRHGLANLWNSINGIAASNPRYQEYINAGRCVCPE